MIGLVLVAHAGLAKELLGAAEMIVGIIDHAKVVSVDANEPVEQISGALTDAVRQVSTDGVIIMTDMFGGTPSNMGLMFLEVGRVEVLTGVNLPMVIKFATERDRFDVRELAAQLRDTGREGITVAGDYLRK